MYRIVNHEGKYAVESVFDNTIIYSRETGKVIAFEDITKAQALKGVLLKNCIEIIDASSRVLKKHSVDSETYGMKIVTD